MTGLVDTYGRSHSYLRISVTDRCNLRCFYCMPHEGIEWRPKDELLSFEEIERISRTMIGMGISKIRLTGGEPLVRKDLVDLVRRLASIEGLERLAITTNALLLTGHARELQEAGVKDINISIDSMRSERFAAITGRDCLDTVKSGITEALSANFERLKLNVVIMSGINDDEILDFIDFIHNKKANVRFIEFMPFKNNDWKVEKVFTYKEMLGKIATRFELFALDSEPSAVAKDYGIKGGIGTVSFITSMSESFCGTCNRLRLTADGNFKTCLFYPAERSLRDLLREGASDAELKRVISETVLQKPEAHPPAEEIAAQENRSMIEIGG